MHITSKTERSVEALLSGHFDALLGGRDVSPAQRYRAEGYLKALVEHTDLTVSRLLELRQPYIDQLQQKLSSSLAWTKGNDFPWALPYQVAVAAVNDIAG